MSRIHSKGQTCTEVWLTGTWLVPFIVQVMMKDSVELVFSPPSCVEVNLVPIFIVPVRLLTKLVFRWMSPQMHYSCHHYFYYGDKTFSWQNLTNRSDCQPSRVLYILVAEWPVLIVLRSSTWALDFCILFPWQLSQLKMNGLSGQRFPSMYWGNALWDSFCVLVVQVYWGRWY